MTTLRICCTAAFFLLLSYAAVADMRERRIPNAISVAMLAVAMVKTALGLQTWRSFAAGVVLAVVLLGAYLLGRGGIGGGDVKLFFGVAAFCGPSYALWLLWLASMIGLLVAAAKRMGMKTRLPLAPCLWSAFVLLESYTIIKGGI